MRYVYLFHEGNARMKELLGGKGANLAEMTNIGLPVPCGMTITTDACREYYNNGKKLPEGCRRGHTESEGHRGGGGQALRGRG